MQPLRTFTIIPTLPEKLKPLEKIAFNLQWTWNHEAIDLFRRLDPDLWEASGHNPVKMLGKIKQSRLEKVLDDDGFVAHLGRVDNALDNYLVANTWFKKTYGDNSKTVIAYFSAEFGLTESVRIYSGGLGILAGDHLKSSSDLGIPLVGVGLLYQEGYFHQYLNADGWQGELYPQNDFYNMPIQLVRNEDKTPCQIEVKLIGRKVTVQIWKIIVGRICLYLLDTNISLNNSEDRRITSELYGGDSEMRIKQEILLGIGGFRALKKIGVKPTVFHMNEGHSAFLALERIRCQMDEYNLSFDEAKELTKTGNVFTTHTPVPAGIDKFSPELMDKYFAHYYPLLKLTKSDFLGLGRRKDTSSLEDFSMAILAINLASYINGVSKLHGDISRKMWKDMWPEIPENEIPITSVTNGIHPSSWISKDMASLYERYLGPTWITEPGNLMIWKRVEEIPSEELWRTHARRRERLVAFARKRLKIQLQNQGALPSEIAKSNEVLNPEALTIGFARRFATYKRATLLFHDPVRLAQIMRNADRPIQIIFAGKAHPKDTPGKELIRKIVHLARMEDFRQHVVFLENYDITLSRYLVQGVDVWLNTPRRYMEASGTSGMKASVNGVLNMSILDGWWDEAYNLNTGWAIGSGEQYDDFSYQDDVESQAIYNLLEHEILPLFYDRGNNGIPRKWIEMMKSSMAEICPVFNTNRMLREYTERFYLPARNKFQELYADDQIKAKDLTKWKSHVIQNWSKIKFLKLQEDGIKETHVGSKIEIKATISLGNLNPDDINVEIYHGDINSRHTIVGGVSELMSCTGEASSENVYTFEGSISCSKSGLYGYTVRILPKSENLTHPHETGLILWAKS